MTLDVIGAVLLNSTAASAQVKMAEYDHNPGISHAALPPRPQPGPHGGDVRMPLHTAAEALAYAEHVIRMTENPSGFDTMAPYVVVDDGESWTVTGTHSMLPSVLDPVHLRLRKSDAKVIEYGLGVLGGWTPPPPR